MTTAPARRDAGATSRAEALAAASRRLAAAGIEQPRRDARLLLGALLEATPEALLIDSERPLTAAEAAGFAALVARRAAREPVSRILGRREFWGLALRLSPDTLDPRPDSETLVEAGLDRLMPRDAAWRLLDLGTGSGCLLLALLSELPNAWGLGVDLSPGAAATARANACALGLAGRAGFAVADWTAGLSGRFDLIVCNPPYVEAAAELAPEVAVYDPPPALFAGTEGLDAYRRLLPQLPALLAPGGQVLLELGAGQAEPVAALARAAGFTRIDARADLSGTPRCLAAGR